MVPAATCSPTAPLHRCLHGVRCKAAVPVARSRLPAVGVRRPVCKAPLEQPKRKDRDSLWTLSITAPALLHLATVGHHAKHMTRRAPACMAAKGPVVVIDNYDSFTYNLCQYLGDLGCNYVVFKNDEKTVEEIKAMDPKGVMVSPGPGEPKESGISLQAVRELGPIMPLFGVCMGHQCIGEAFGGDVIRAPTGLMHGKTSPVYHTNVGVLQGMENPFDACRYHSLVIKRETIPEDLEITAWTEDGNIMGVRHKKYPHIQGVQFHPESIITQNGKTIVKNWVDSLNS